MPDFNLDDLNLDGIVDNPALQFGNPSRDLDMGSVPGSMNCRRLTSNSLEDLYASSAKCQRVCRKIPTQVVRAGWEVQLVGDGIEVQQKEFRRAFPNWLRKTKLSAMLIDAMTWSNIYHEGAGILLDVDDGQRRDLPVRVETIRSVKPLYCLDGETLAPVRLGSAATGEIDYFLDSLDYTSSQGRPSHSGGPSTNVHPSRVLWFEGVKLPPRALARLGGGASKLQQFWNSYQRYELAYQAMSNALHRQQVLLMGIQGLMEQLAATGGIGGQAQLKAQMESIFSMMHNQGFVAYDQKRQKFEILKRDISSFPAAIAQLKEDMISESGLSEMALFGVTKVGSGLSGMDVRDRLHMAEEVSNVAEDELRAPLEQFLRYAFHSTQGPTQGKSPDDWVLTFNSSLTLTDAEKADLVSKMATADTAYSQMVPGLGEALVTSRFGSGEWSLNTQLPNSLPKAPQSEGMPVPYNGETAEMPAEEELTEEAAAESFAEELDA